MTSSYRTIDVYKEKNRVKKTVNVTFNTLMIYFILYHTYTLLNYRGRIQMTSSYRTIDVYKE